LFFVQLIERHGRLGKFFVSFLGLFSISSAYLFGMVQLFPAGMRTLVDYRFFANELLAFILFSAGFGALVRLQFYIMLAMLFRFDIISPPFGKNIRRFKYLNRKFYGYIFALLLVPALFILGLAAVSLHYDPFAFLGWIFASFILMVVLIFVYKSTFGFDAEISTRAFFSQPFFASLVVGYILFLSLSLGSLRMKSLAMADDVCVVTNNEVIVGKLLGETGSGLFLKIGDFELRGFLEKISELLYFGNSHHDIILISRDVIFSVNSFCTAKPA
jgi:hypothetical protein